MTNWTKVAPTVSEWETPPENMGQIVDYSYGYDEDGTLWERRIDHSDGEVDYREEG